MKLVGYLRVSSEGQLDGYGLDAQARTVRAWCRTNGHRLLRTVTDVGVSGATDALDRPGLADALDAVRAGEADGIVVARLDRLARALTVQEATLAIVWRADGAVFAADQGMVMQDDPDDPMRTALRQVVGVFSELERRLVTKRLRDGRAAKAATGKKHVGSYRYGYRPGGTGRARDEVLDPQEHVTVRLILRCRAEGWSYRQIGAHLNSAGIPAKFGGPWHPTSVRSVVLAAQQRDAARRTRPDPTTSL